MNVEANTTVHVNTIDQAWEFWYNVISTLAKNGRTDSSRDGEVVGEVLNAVTVIDDPTRCILRSPMRNLPMRYCIGELLWYLSGNPNLSAIQLYTNAWDRMSDNGSTVNSNYGYIIQGSVDRCNGEDENCVDQKRYFDQMKMCEKLLRKDPNTRQAVIHIKSARDVVNYPTKDLNCTVCLQFFIREGKLYMTTYMRSNDLWMGFPNDVFQFTCMQVYMAMRLNVGLGSYTHIAGSLHLYERDYKKSLENIEKIEKEASKSGGAGEDTNKGC